MAKTTSFCARLVVALISVLFVASCSNDDGGIKMKTSPQITVYADDTSADGAIRFDASDSWKASVNYLTGEGAADWITLSAYSGGVGECSISITFKPNTTGKDRKATVTIDTGETTVTIAVEQKAAAKDGDDVTIPDTNTELNAGLKIRKIIKRGWYSYGNKTEDDGEETYEFSYDSSNRLVKIVHTEVDELAYNDGYAGQKSGQKSTETTVTTCSITYGTGTASYEITTAVDGVVQTAKPSGNIVLENGRAVSGEYIDYDEKDPGVFSKSVATYKLAYDNDGRLVKSSLTETGANGNGKSTTNETITWTDGNPVQVEWGYSGNTKLIDKASYGIVKNNANLDLNWFFALDSEGWDFATGDPYKVFAVIGCLGTRSVCLASSMTDGAEVVNYGNRVYLYSYEQNGTTGLPVKMTRKTDDGYYGSGCEYTILY